MRTTARWLSCVALVFAATIASSISANADDDQADAKPKPKYKTVSVRGKVVWLAEALKSEFGISTVSEAAEQSLAILTDDRKLIPIVEDLRGRSFRKDERLRDMKVELFARQYKHQPLLQIVRLYEIDGDKKYEVDYWCDVCAIVMYETGPCACCQDHNRLRKRIVINGQAGDEVDWQESR